MTEEIKEILESLNKIAKTEYYPEDLLTYKECEILLNYITNLQKENEKLKEENKRIFSRVNDDELLISNAMNYAELQDYKQRNEKAIEYIEERKNLNWYADGVFVYELLNILNGGDE